MGLMDTEGFSPTSDVTLEAPEVNQDQVTLVPPGDTTLIPGKEVSEKRARRYSIAMGDQELKEGDIDSILRTGGEQNLRQTAALNEESRQRQERSERFISLATSGKFNPNLAHQAYQEYTQPIKVNPDTVMEENFGFNYLKLLFGANAAITKLKQAAAEEDPQATMAALDGSQRLLARQAMLEKNLEDAITASGKWDIGFDYTKGITGNAPSKLLNKLGTMFPVVPGVLYAGPENRSVESAILPGRYLEEARRKLLQFRTNEEAKAWVTVETKRIAEFNPEEAVNFAQAMVDFNMEDKFVYNVIGAADVTPFGSIATGVKLAATGKFVSTFADVLRGAKASTRMEDVFVAVGDVQSAGDVLRAKRATFVKGDPLGLADALKELPWDRNPSAIIERNPGTMAADNARKTTAILTDSWAKAKADLLRSTRVQRVPREAHDPMRDHTVDRIHQEFPSTNDYVFNSRLRYEPINNAYYGETMLGERDGTALRSIDRAEYVARNEIGLKDNEFKIVSLNGTEVGDVIPINSAGMARTKALQPIADAAKIPGFKSIQGTVRLKDGTEIKVSNRKDGIYRIDALSEQVMPSDITHFKTSAKGAAWAAVPSEKVRKVQGIFKGNEIRQEGLGYYISIVRAADETAPEVRAALLIANNKAPVSLANWALGGMARSAEDQVPYFQRSGRHIATHAPNAILARIGEMVKPIGRLNKESWEALSQILERNRDFSETIDGELVRGRAFKSQAKLEQEWMDIHHRPPTDQESLAYWTYHQVMDLDWIMRNIGVHRDLARVGVSERYTVYFGEDRTPVSHPGKFVHEIPWQAKSDPGILIVTGENPVEFKYASKVSPVRRKELDDMLQNGYKAIVVANPVDRPYRKQLGSGATVNIVISKDLESAPLPMNLVDRNPGVHVVYPQEWMIKQPIVAVGEKGRNNYYGDLTILAADTEKEANRLAKAVDELRLMFIKEGNGENISHLINRHIDKNLPRDYDFWHTKFYGKGIIEPYLALDHPIRPVYSGSQVLELHRDLRDLPQYQNLKNERNSEFNLMRAIDMDFMADRDAPLMQVANKGSIDKPIWDLEKARVLDPMTSIQRTTANSVRQLYLNDVKASAIEQWAAQFGKYLTDPEMAKNNPFQAFYHGKFAKDAWTNQELQAAKNVQARILNFIGTQTELGRDLHWFNSMSLNAIEKLEGKSFLGQPLVAKGGTRYYNDHELRFVKDPIAFFRSLLFTAKFGTPVNIKQFLVQAQGFTNVLGIMTGRHGLVEGPKITGMAMAAYSFQRGRDLTEAISITNELSNKMRAWGWDKKQYLEASQWMKDDGWKIVGNEHAYRDAFDPEIFTYKGKKVLAAYPFYEGERLTRMVSGYAAYLEWRKANPKAIFDEFAKGEVLVRADDLSTNMTRASNSRLQESGWRLASQFYTFSHRLLDQYWGKRLTGREKAGLFATQSIAYGVPAAAGAATFYSIYDYIRSQVLIDNELGVGPAKISVKPNDAWFQIMTEGFIQYGIYHATGRRYDIQGRYGPGPGSGLSEFLRGDKDIFEFAGGATGTFIRDMFLGTLAPAYRVIYSSLKGGDVYQPTFNDIKPLLTQFAVFNDYGNALVMYNTGKYLSKSGREVHEGLDGMDAAALILGAQRREVKDVNLIFGYQKDAAKVQTAAMNAAMNEYRLGYQYMRDNDLSKADVNFGNADIYLSVFGDVTDEQRKQVRRRVTSELGTLVEEANASLYKRGYDSKIPARIKRAIGEL